MTNEKSNLGSLVLTRHKGQSFKIGKDVLVEVIKIQDGIVVIRVEAPKSVNIQRTELTIKPKDKANDNN